MEENYCHALVLAFFFFLLFILKINILKPIDFKYQVDKRLPCGHHQRIDCSTPVESITCTACYDQVLGCRHTVSTLCGESLERDSKYLALSIF